MTNVDPEFGLTAEQLKSAPKNIPPHQKTLFEVGLQIAKNQVLSFFFILLIASGVLSLLLGEKLDGIVFFSIAMINAVLGFIQEYRANTSAELLQKMVQHNVTVKREGKLITIPHSEIALSDIILLNPGDVVVVDTKAVVCNDAFLDESVVTGETLPRLVKTGETIPAGVNVSSGTITGQVVSVGQDNSLIKYADKLSKVQKNSSFEKFIYTVSKAILITAVSCLAAVFVVNVLITRGMALPEYILFSISMLVGVVPESLPLIVTIILTREALILSKERVLVKKLTALENIGGMNFLLTDKTGTITENNLQVKQLLVIEQGLDAALQTIRQAEYKRTPMDEVFDKALNNYYSDKTSQKQEVVTIDFDPYKVSRGYAIHTFPDKTEVIRGQYNAVFNSCQVKPEKFLEQCQQLETQGLRIIALAKRKPEESDFVLLGAIVFEDPLKSDAVSIYKKLKEIGMKVKIITGDSLQVAEYIGQKLEPQSSNDIAFSMENFENSDKNDQLLNKYFIYAKCKPEQKSTIIDEHSKQGVVGFLGEGINDALALKRADIGFVVSNGSDVARQAGDVILLEKSLKPIVQAIIMSRQAFLKIRTYLLCTLTGNIGTLLSLTAVVLFSQIIPMLPIQILLNNLLTDLPLLFLITDRVSNKSLEQPIKNPIKPFFKTILIYAAISSLFDFLFFFAFKQYDISILRTGWFVFSVLAELTLVFSLRSELSIFKAPKMSAPLAIVIGICYALALSLPFLQFGPIFRFVPLSIMQISAIIGLSLIYLVTNELVKAGLRWRNRPLS